MVAVANASAWLRILVAITDEPARVEETRKVLSEPDEAVLADVRASLRGDGEAYARIIQRYQAILARRMVRFGRNAAAVDELVHDVFVEAYFSLRKYRADAPLEHWLQRIATRVGYRYWKRQRHRPAISIQQDVHDQAVDDLLRAAVDLTEQVAAILEKLGPRDRLVLTLLYIEDRSVAETAELAGWSQTMVKVQAYRARKKLRKLLDANEDER